MNWKRINNMTMTSSSGFDEMLQLNVGKGCGRQMLVLETLRGYSSVEKTKIT